MKSAFAFVALIVFLPLGAAADVQNNFLVSVYADFNTPPQSIRYELLDGLVLYFINPVNGCSGFEQTVFPNVQDIVLNARLQEEKGHPIIVTFSIGGGGNDAVNTLLESIASSADCRQQFASQVAAILADNDLDGVDLDWEFPKSSSLGNYTLLVQALREAIGTKLLSIAIYNDAGKEDPANHLTPDVFPYVDYYLVMAYLAPRNAAIDGWINPPWNLPESKLRLGLAFFGNSAKGPSGYNQLLGSVSASEARPCGDQVGAYTINGLRTTGELTRFAMTEGLGGITGWQLGQDRTDSISLLNVTSDTARMWSGFDQWQAGTAYSAGTVVQYQGNLWWATSSASPTAPAPSLSNPAYKQYEVLKEFSAQDYYCGGDEIWFNGTVYRADEDPPLSITDQSPTATPSLWQKLYSVPLYNDTTTYKKSARVFFNNSVYVANKKTRGQSPAEAAANWTPFVDTQAYDSAKSYSSGANVRYMENDYVALKSSVGANPVVATDSWAPVKK